MSKHILKAVMSMALLLTSQTALAEFVTNTSFEALARREVREYAKHILNKDYLVSCNMVIPSLADCAVLVIDDQTAFQAFCWVDGCIVDRIPSSPDTKED